jgi:hypothetical protein
MRGVTMKYQVQIAYGEGECTEPVVVEATPTEAQDLCLMTERALDALPEGDAEVVHDVIETYVDPVR